MAMSIDVFEKEVYKTLDEISNNSKKTIISISKIVSGSDWSFVIKVHALIESSLSRLLIAKTDDVLFAKFFDRMSISQKVDLLKQLKLLENYECTFINNVSKLRNKLAHSPDEWNFTFKKHFKTMTETEQNVFINGLCLTDKQKPGVELVELFKLKPKYAIWISANISIILLNNREEIIKLGKTINDAQLDESERLLKQHLPELFLKIKK